MVWKAFLVVALIFGFLSSAIAFRTSLVASLSAPLDPKDPFSIQVTFQNTSQMALRHVVVRCNDNQVSYAGNFFFEAGGAATVPVYDADIVGRGESFTASCPQLGYLFSSEDELGGILSLGDPNIYSTEWVRFRISSRSGENKELVVRSDHNHRNQSLVISSQRDVIGADVTLTVAFTTFLPLGISQEANFRFRTRKGANNLLNWYPSAVHDPLGRADARAIVIKISDKPFTKSN